jgi:hypothetical protein
VQSNLPAATISGVQTAVVSEANHRPAVAPCTRPLSTGDTKAEENGWDSGKQFYFYKDNLNEVFKTQTGQLQKIQ